VSARWRRVLLFVLMVAAGLTAVRLLSDPGAASRGGDPLGAVDPAAADGRIRLREGSAREETQIVLGEVEFDILQSVEVSPGLFEERTTARAHMLSARPDPDGSILAERPTVSLLDWRSGEENGRLSSERARFETAGAVGGSITLDLFDLRSERFELSGAVSGRFPLPEGGEARLECESLQVAGEIVTAPDFVTLAREDVVLSGHDFHWDRATGRLLIDHDARLRFAATAERPGLDLKGPGGLTWTVPPGAAEPSRAAYGELRGLVTGQATDGSRLASQGLLVDLQAGRLELSRQAWLSQPLGENGRRELHAERITLHGDAQGRFALAEANGDVRLLSAPFAVLPAWVLTERLLLREGSAEAPGHVTWGRDDITASGTQVHWDDVSGRLEAERDAEIVVSEGDRALSGLRLVAPGGMSLHLPPGSEDPLAAGSGELRGRVRGTLPDGTAFDTDLLLFDGSERAFTLQGGSVVQRQAEGRVSRLDGERITLRADEHGKLAFLSAEGEVLLVDGPVDVLPARLVTEHLEAEDGVISAPGAVSWTREGLTVIGQGMRWHEAEQRLELHRDARLVLVDPEPGRSAELFAAGGLSWTLPADSLAPAHEGHGELQGRVTGTTDTGEHFEADRALLDGARGRLTLLGQALVRLPHEDGELSLQSEELLAELPPDGSTRRLSSSRAVRFRAGALHGSGTGLLWDAEAGHLQLLRDIVLNLPADPVVSLAGAGPLDVHLVGGEQPALQSSRGVLQGSVTGTLQGGTPDAPGARDVFSADALAWDVPAERLELRGGARWERQESADGRVLRLAGQTLTADRGRHRFELLSEAEVTSGEGAETWRAAADSLVVTTDAEEQLRELQGLGRVRLQQAELVALADSLHWDVPADFAVLEGNGRLLTSGMWMSFARAELSPRAETFRILRAAIHVDG